MTEVESYMKPAAVKVNAAAERKICHDRARHICQRCTMRKSTQAHHVLLRKHGGTDSADNLIALCDECHRTVHSVTGDSYIEGWLRRRHPKPGDYWYGRES